MWWSLEAFHYNANIQIAKMQKPHLFFVDCVIFALCKLLTLACNYYIAKLAQCFRINSGTCILWWHWFNSSSYGFIHKRQQALWPNGLSRMTLKTKYLTVGSTIIIAIDRPYTHEPLPIKPKSFLWNCLISGKCHRLLYISEKRVRISSDCHFFVI